MPAKKTGKVGLARRYATALFDLAKQEKALESVAKDLEALDAMLVASPELVTAAKSPVLPTAEIGAVFETLLKQQKAQDITLRTVALLAANRRLAILRDVVEAFRRLVSADKGEVTVEVTSAVPLSTQNRAALETAIKKLVGKQVALKEQVNQNILGGLKVKLGSELIDASVEGRLERLARAQKIANIKG